MLEVKEQVKLELGQGVKSHPYVGSNLEYAEYRVMNS